MHKQAKSEDFRKLCARRLGCKQLQVLSDAPHVPSGDNMMLSPQGQCYLGTDSKHNHADDDCRIGLQDIITELRGAAGGAARGAAGGAAGRCPSLEDERRRALTQRQLRQ